MAQSNLRAPHCEALVFGALLRQLRHRLKHRDDRPGRNAHEDREERGFGQVVPLHLRSEKLAAEMSERWREHRRKVETIVRSAKITGGCLEMEIHHRMFGTRSDRRFFAAVRPALS